MNQPIDSLIQLAAAGQGTLVAALLKSRINETHVLESEEFWREYLSTDSRRKDFSLDFGVIQLFVEETPYWSFDVEKIFVGKIQVIHNGKTLLVSYKQTDGFDKYDIHKVFPPAKIANAFRMVRRLNSYT